MITEQFKDLQYLTVFPKGYVEGEKCPVMIFLHGAGTRGNDIDKLKGIPFSKTYLFTVIFHLLSLLLSAIKIRGLIISRLLKSLHFLSARRLLRTPSAYISWAQAWVDTQRGSLP